MKTITETEKIIKSSSFHITNITLGCSFALGCQVWKVNGKEIYLTDYDFTEIETYNTVKKERDLRDIDTLLFFVPNKGRMYISTFELTKEILNEWIDKFETNIKEENTKIKQRFKK